MRKAKTADATAKEGALPCSMAEVSNATHATNGCRQVGTASEGRKEAPARRAKGGARPCSVAVALKLHGTRGRMFDRQADGRWLDTDTGTVGTRAELERAWLAGLQEAPAGEGL